MLEIVKDKDGVDHDAGILKFRKKILADTDHGARIKSTHETTIEYLAQENGWELKYTAPSHIRLMKDQDIALVNLNQEGFISVWQAFVWEGRVQKIVDGEPADQVDFLSGCDLSKSPESLKRETI